MKTMEIKIATPCHARWEDMQGDDRRRFCGQCQKHVYNFTHMDDDQIVALVKEKDGQLCGRMYQRPDGTMLVEDCPRGVERQLRRIKTLACGVAALLFLGATAAFARQLRQPTPDSAATRKVRQTVDDALWTVKGWIGIQRPMLAGKICIPQPASTNAPSGGSKGTLGRVKISGGTSRKLP